MGNVSDLIADQVKDLEQTAATDADRKVAEEIMDLLKAYATGQIETEESLDLLQGLFFLT